MKKFSTKLLSLVLSTTMIANVGQKTFAEPVNNTDTIQTVVELLKKAMEANNTNSTSNSNSGMPMKKFILANSFSSMLGGSIGNVLTIYCVQYVFNMASRHLIPGKGFNNDIDEVYVKLNMIFDKTVIGQENVRLTILGKISDFLMYLSEKKLNHTNFQKRGHVLYLVGESGTGKSICANAIADALLKNSNTKMIVDSASVPFEGDNKIKNPDSLFRPSYCEGNSNSQFLRSTNIFDHILRNPETVVIMNEYDKFFDETLDERMRSIVDNGIINASNAQLECDSVLFIITSNEGRESFPSRTDIKWPEHKSCNKEKLSTQTQEKTTQEESNQEKSAQKAATQETSTQTQDETTQEESNQEKETQKAATQEENKGNGSAVNEKEDRSKYGTTIRKHDASAVNRHIIAPLSPLQEKDHEIITRNFLEKKCKEVKRFHNIDLIYDEDLIKKIASFSNGSPLGGRVFPIYLNIPFNTEVSSTRVKGYSGTFILGFEVEDNGRAIFTLKRNYSQKDVDDIILSAEEFLNFNVIRNFLETDKVGEDLAKYLNKKEYKELSQNFEQAKKIKTEEDFESHKQSIDKIQELMSTAKTRYLWEKIEGKKNRKNWIKRIFSIFH